MGEPRNIGKSKSYNQLMAQYNRLLRGFSYIDDLGEYDDAMAEREHKVDEIMNRYADNIERSRAWNKAKKAGQNPDAVPIPRRIYARNNRK